MLDVDPIMIEVGVVGVKLLINGPEQVGAWTLKPTTKGIEFPPSITAV